MVAEAEEFARQDRERRDRVEKRNRAKALTDQAQRKLREVTLDFGSQFTTPYRRDVENLCSEILDSLEKNDDRRLDRSQSDLEDVLYELNREVRLQYQDEDEGLFESIKKTFIGDEDDDYSYDYNPRDNRNVYRNPDPTLYGGRISSGRDYGDRNYASSANNNNDYPYSGSSISRPSSPPPRSSSPSPRQDSPRRYEDYPPENDRRYRVNKKRNIPYENDWDDDDWF